MTSISFLNRGVANRLSIWVAALLLLSASLACQADQLLVEAESFNEQGGWKLDTQFIHTMGSPYLLAHGLGKPVADATTRVTFPSPGQYRVFVRTKDWVAPWDAPGAPGKFQIVVDGKVHDHVFGTTGKKWQWEAGGAVEISGKEVSLALRDLTGFDGRCDAIYFTKSDAIPPGDSTILPDWRRKLLDLPQKPVERGGYDLVVLGGGYSGMGAAISAARMGCKVALIQDRPVLGGNGSSEVRVWSQGLIRRGRYPRVGEIIEEFSDSAAKSPGTYEEFEDAKKEAIVRDEANIDLFLNHFAYEVDSTGGQIEAVYALDTRTSEAKRFVGKLFVDCTGHGTIGFLAGADWEMTPDGRMGMSNMWAWASEQENTSFPKTPWALPLEMKDFPYPVDHHGQWFWESGFDKDPIGEAELIRDWNLRAVYGAFNAMKNGDGAAEHQNASLTWVAFVGGPRESRRLLGDILLTGEHIMKKVEFPDGCVPSTWSIDLHYPKKQYAKKFPDNPFISIAVHDRNVDRSYGYPVPYRCFYSRNISNLFMAGRCASVTHEALGTVRVMRTCGMMGEVVGKAASICSANNCSPREVYEKYWDNMDELLQLPGKAYRETVRGEIIVPDDALELAPAKGAPYDERVRVRKDRPLKKLSGLVVDDDAAEKTGNWQVGSNLKGYVGKNYVYATGNSSIRYDFKAPETGRFEIRMVYGQHANRGRQVPVEIKIGDESRMQRVDMTKAPALENNLHPLGVYAMQEQDKVSVTISTEGAGGTVHADAVQIVPAAR